jgi:disulfide bond formation protein DsbB
MTSLGKARLVALLVPALLLNGAYDFQYFPQAFGLPHGLFPCEMCWWQRYPHFAAIALVLLDYAFVRRPPVSRLFVLLAAASILVSGLIGVFHAGVEYHWWQGLTHCTSNSTLTGSHGDMLHDLMATPLIRCDTAQWTLWGVSLAGWNALFSCAAAILILWLIRKPLR